MWNVPLLLRTKEGRKEAQILLHYLLIANSTRRDRGVCASIRSLGLSTAILWSATIKQGKDLIISTQELIFLLIAIIGCPKYISRISKARSTKNLE
jgi:hypothetical protein